MRQLRHTGDGPRYYKFGRSVRYEWADVHAWKEAQARDATREGTVPQVTRRNYPPVGVGRAPYIRGVLQANGWVRCPATPTEGKPVSAERPGPGT